MIDKEKKWVKRHWRMESSGYLPDYFKARDILAEAYYSGLIDWNVYQAAWSKTEQVGNGSWMFETK